jgi:Na+-translocating ferredoxin:NAD+ oxidoreductase RnfD subunit
MSTQIAINPAPIKVAYNKFMKIDARLVVLAILFSYLVLGFTVLGFNRTPYQALITTVSTGLFEVLLARIFKKKWIFPLSALITSCSLSILLNYSHNYWVLMVPVYFAIGSKYVFTFNGRHFFNPAQIAVTMSLLFTPNLITVAPAYQWNGIAAMGAFIAMFGIFLLLPKINRHWLVITFLATFTAQTYLRAMIMKHHLPFETLFLGTLTSPAFLLFTFFMITDPQTSPPTRKGQVIVGFFIAFVDLILHLKQSYYTFFIAGAVVQSTRAMIMHGKALKETGSLTTYLKERLIDSDHYKRVILIVGLALAANGLYTTVIKPRTSLENLPLKFETVTASQTGINPVMGKTLERVDVRVQHLAKWLLSVGDSVAAGDVNGDGLADLYFTFPLKNDQHRNSLYINKGNFKFERYKLPITKESANIEENGLASNVMFVDYDNDQDKDIFITYAFGSPILLKNLLKETGEFSLVNATKEAGLDQFTNSISANFFDFNKDGRLDLIIGNVWPEYLPDYPADQPERLNLFKLPQAEYAGDERMFNFMHASWHMANNGGTNHLFIQNEDGTFQKLDSKKLNLPETRWTLAIATADFNQDGWTDLYVANDFGADDLYYNNQGKDFSNIKGEMFGDVGRDTYKGMNATIGDFDNNGTSDVYISNVHHAYQAEGSLLWMWLPNEKGIMEPKEMATRTNALNENRFGWGAATGDLDLNGRLDIVQANGMVDDTIDKKWDECPDYWYVNEKIARSAPSFHRYTNKWGDIRGFCIYGKEQNRVYLNMKDEHSNMFVDAATQVGVTEKTNSRGVSMVDLDNDGKLDMVVTHMFSGPTIYRNTMKSESNWVGIDIQSKQKTCNSEAIGSIVTISYPGKDGVQKQMREKVIVNGFNAQSDNRIHFGLGDYQGPINVKVKWCLQETKEYTFNNINQYHRLVY